MRWSALIVTSGRRLTAERTYLHACEVAAGLHTSQPASWWGLCAMLSSHQLQHATLRPMGELWSELLPFLHIRDEGLAMRAVAEYLLYLEAPALADKQWLGIHINQALTRVDTYDGAVAELLESPARVFEGRWMALLSYETLLRVRRAVALYSVRPPQAQRAAFWHGVPVVDEDADAVAATALT